MHRQRKRTRNAACHPVAIPGPRMHPANGYIPTAQRRVIRYAHLKGSDKRYLAVREWARHQDMHVGPDNRGLERRTNV